MTPPGGLRLFRRREDAQRSLLPLDERPPRQPVSPAEALDERQGGGVVVATDDPTTFSERIEHPLIVRGGTHPSRVRAGGRDKGYLRLPMRPRSTSIRFWICSVLA
jgi:hypothetical protein